MLNSFLSAITEYKLFESLEINSLFNKDYTIEESMMFADFKTYLPDDILCKIDRSSMYYGLETRTPFIDQDIVNFAHSLPLNFKIYKNISKWILKEILKKYLPEKLFLRPKKGFAIPIRYWLGNELKDWTESLLSKQTCDIHGLFNFDVINKYKMSILLIIIIMNINFGQLFNLINGILRIKILYQDNL